MVRWINLFRSHNIEVSDKQYQEDAVYTYLCEQPLDDEISEITNGAYLPVFIKECIIDVALQGVKNQSNRFLSLDLYMFSNYGA